MKENIICYVIGVSIAFLLVLSCSIIFNFTLKSDYWFAFSWGGLSALVIYRKTLHEENNE